MNKEKTREEKVNEMSLLIPIMAKCKKNLIVFRNNPKILALYHLGIYFGIPTIIIIRKKDEKYIERLKHPLVKKFIKVDKFSSASVKEAAKKVIGAIKIIDAVENKKQSKCTAN